MLHKKTCLCAEKHVGCFLGEDINMANSTIRRQAIACQLLLAGFMLAAGVSLSSTVMAVELTADTPALAQSESLAAGQVTAFQGEEVYGLEKFSKSVEELHNVVAVEKVSKDNEAVEEVSFIVAGEVSNPGEYSLSPPVSLLAAVLTGGGPSSSGSLRRVAVYQTGTLLGEYDLYSFLREGRIADDFIFNGGEQIVFLPCGPRVAISGGVKTPAVFELKEGEMTLAMALDLAGGFDSGEGSWQVEVTRLAGVRQIIAFSADVVAGGDVPAFNIEAGDRIRVLRNDSSRPANVYVRFPENVSGNFSHQSGMKISDLIDCLRPLPENIALGYAELLREGRSDNRYEVIGISIDVLLQQLAFGDKSNDFMLYPGDCLVLFDREIFDKKPVVGIEMPGKPLLLVDFKPGMTVCDLLDNAEIRLPEKGMRSVVCRRQLNGSRLEVVRLAVDLEAVCRKGEQQNIELQPFDTLLVQY
jgi:protein involved in polysaccharide export with SLBB domain